MKRYKYLLCTLILSCNLYGQDTITRRGGESLNELTKNGNKVFVDSDDKGVISHASYEIGKWGYWLVVKDLKKADFVLRFSCRSGIFNGKGYAEFLNPDNEELLLRIDQPPGIVINMNSKRGNIKRFVREIIIPRFD